MAISENITVPLGSGAIVHVKDGPMPNFIFEKFGR